MKHIHNQPSNQTEWHHQIQGGEWGNVLDVLSTLSLGSGDDDNNNGDDDNSEVNRRSSNGSSNEKQKYIQSIIAKVLSEMAIFRIGWFWWNGTGFCYT